jgi:hypothetical protein
MATIHSLIVALGVALFGAPCSAAMVTIFPGETIQTTVDANPPGTTYQLAPGLFVMQSIVPKDGDFFQGMLGADGKPLTILSGARVLNFTREGAYWVASGQTQQGIRPPDGDPQYCLADHPRCRYPEDLFIDDAPLLHVGSLDSLREGGYFFSYPDQKIYLASDPAGHRVETSVTPAAFSGNANSVIVRHLIVEKYASPNQMGAIGALADVATGWHIDRVVVRWNHGAGVRLGTNGRITNSWIGSNGEIGITGQGDNLLIENNEISHNGRGGTIWEWEGGGTKFLNTQRLVVRNNFSHHNLGPGLWTDFNNIDTLYEYNRVMENEGPGIFHEVSYKAIIRRNTVNNNGRSTNPYWYWYSAIQLAGSSDVDIYENTIEVNAEKYANGISLIQQFRGPGAYGPLWLHNNSIHHNAVTLTGAGLRALATIAQDNTTYGDALNPASQNVFDYNSYYLPGATGDIWVWGDTVSWPGWQGFGQDLHGAFHAASGLSETTSSSDLIDTTSPPLPAEFRALNGQSVRVFPNPPLK